MRQPLTPIVPLKGMRQGGGVRRIGKSINVTVTNSGNISQNESIIKY